MSHDDRTVSGPRVESPKRLVDTRAVVLEQGASDSLAGEFGDEGGHEGGLPGSAAAFDEHVTTQVDCLNRDGHASAEFR
ncbi:hypothetical protein AB2L57_09605 [Microbacterium sp. HA-8]|uniref:hypothetical protein n=1 Tax=Microbacterium sp. HA-8 TaxID=3234200 RepID=UPI0038F62142